MFGGILGYPVSDELTNPDGVGERNSFQEVDGHVYWSPATGAHEVQGRIYQEWGQLSWERGTLGYPVSDEVATTGAFVRTRGGGRGPTGRRGRWLPGRHDRLRATRGHLRLRGRVPRRRPISYPTVARSGFANRSGNAGADDEADAAQAGFGIRHAQDDHNVSQNAVRALIENDRVPYPSRTAAAADNRYVYTEFSGVGGDPATAAESISVVVQRAPDREGLAPDRYDGGLVTAHCNRGIPSSSNYQRRCPDDLPPPPGSRPV